MKTIFDKSFVFHSVGIQIEQTAYTVNEVDGALQVCARIIPVNGSIVPFDPQVPRGAQAQVQIGLDFFFPPPTTITATLSTVQSTGTLAATGNRISCSLVLFL